MKNLRELLNTKKGKVIAWICILLVAMLASMLVIYFRLTHQNDNEAENALIERSTKQEDTIIVEYPKLSGDEFKIDKENKTIIINNPNATQVAFSDDEYGPTENDIWHSISGDEPIELIDAEIKKKYVYFLDGGAYSSSKSGTLIAKISYREYRKQNDYPAYCSIISFLGSDNRRWTSPILIANRSDAVSFYTNDYGGPYGSAGSFSYMGQTWYYSSYGYAMQGEDSSGLGRKKYTSNKVEGQAFIEVGKRMLDERPPYLAFGANEALMSIAIANVEDRIYYKKYGETAYCASVDCGGYKGPILVGASANSVAYGTSHDSTISTYMGSFYKKGIPWYYSSDGYRMQDLPANYTDGLGRPHYNKSGSTNNAYKEIALDFLSKYPTAVRNLYTVDVNPDEGIESFDIQIAGESNLANQTDYYNTLYEGATATITNVKTKPGYTFIGQTTSGKLSCTVVGETINLSLGFGGTGAISLNTEKKTYKVNFHPNILPEGYTQVEYIESTGTQYIDIGTKFNSNNDKFELTYQASDASGNYFIAGSGFGEKGKIWIYSYKDGGRFSVYITDTSGTQREIYGFAGPDALKHNVIYDAKKLYVDNELKTDNSSYTFGETPYNFSLFNAINSTGYYSKAKIYAFKLWRNGTLTRDMIPCYRTSDKESGFYDLVEGRFYTNDGTGKFIVSNLPEEYQEVEYIESTGTQYIDTGFKHNQDTRFLADIDYKSQVNWQAAFGSWGGTSSSEARYFGGEKSSNGNYVVHYGDSAYGFSTYTGRMIWDFNKNVIKIGSDSITLTYSTFESRYNDIIFGITGYTGNAQQGTTMKLYSFKIFDNGTIVRDYVPCYRKSEGVIGLYDRVNNQFYTDAGTGTEPFQKGNNVYRPPVYTQEFTYDVAEDLTPNRFMFDGYTFVNWNTRADGTGDVYTNEQEVLNLASPSVQVVDLYAIWKDSLVTQINLVDYNTFTYTADGALAYYVSTSATMPTAGTIEPSNTFVLNSDENGTWTKARGTGDLNLSEGVTYYVWAKDALTGGNVSTNNVSISVQKITRSQGTGSTLTAKYTNQDGEDIIFTNDIAYVLFGTKVYFKANAEAGYVSPVLNVNGETRENIPKLTIKPNGGSLEVTSPTGGTAETITTDKTYKQNYNTTLTYTIPIKGNTTETRTFTVSYNTDGGSTAPENQTSLVTIVKKHKFSNWVKGIGFEGTLNETNKTYTFSVNGDINSTITAYYTSSEVSRTAEAITLGASPTKVGYVFTGWKSSTNGQVYSAGASYAPTGNTQMTAQWRTCSHSYGGWTTTKAATCTGTGSRYRTCSICGYVNTESISALGHSYGGWTTTSAATCEGTGSKRRTCSRCGNVDTASIPALGHDWTAYGDPNYAVPYGGSAVFGGTTVYYRHCRRCNVWQWRA